MTLQQLCGELERTRPAWEGMDLDGVLADGQLPVLSQDAQRHQVVTNELLRPRPRSFPGCKWHRCLSAQSGLSDLT